MNANLARRFPKTAAGQVDPDEINSLANSVHAVSVGGGHGPRDLVDRLGVPRSARAHLHSAVAKLSGLQPPRESARPRRIEMRFRESAAGSEMPLLDDDVTAADGDQARVQAIASALGFVDGGAEAQHVAQVLPNCETATDLCTALGIPPGDPRADLVAGVFNGPGDDDPDDATGDNEETTLESFLPHGSKISLRFTDPDEARRAHAELVEAGHRMQSR